MTGQVSLSVAVGMLSATAGMWLGKSMEKVRLGRPIDSGEELQATEVGGCHVG